MTARPGNDHRGRVLVLSLPRCSSMSCVRRLVVAAAPLSSTRIMSALPVAPGRWNTTPLPLSATRGAQP